MNDLQKIEGARLALYQAKEFVDILKIKDIGAAAIEYAKAAKLGLDAQNEAAELTQRAKRKAGEVLSTLEKGKPGPKDITSSGNNSEYKKTLEESNTSMQEAGRWQNIAKIPESKFEQVIQEAKDAHKEITDDMMLKLAKTGNVHVSNNSGENEWYTPPEIIKMARAVMGSIDTDPASCIAANKTVQAGNIFTIKNSGLLNDWSGNVWMNPPYAQPLISEFCKHLKGQFIFKKIKQFIVLVNNATETGWFLDLVSISGAVCFPLSRIKFVDKNGIPGGAPLQGQAILYGGKNVEKFISTFKEFGWMSKIVEE